MKNQAAEDAERGKRMVKEMMTALHAITEPNEKPSGIPDKDLHLAVKDLLSSLAYTAPEAREWKVIAKLEPFLASPDMLEELAKRDLLIAELEKYVSELEKEIEELHPLRAHYKAHLDIESDLIERDERIKSLEEKIDDLEERIIRG